jgi:predicted dehydrogenase
VSGAGPRLLVIGAGSIGRRHASNLTTAGATVDITDPQPGRADEAPAGRPVPFPPGDMGAYDGVVVASPTAAHSEQAMAALTAGAKVLVEKPLALTGDQAKDVVEAAGDRIMVGYNLRLHEPLQRLVGAVRDGRVGEVIAARLWFGSYLPDWRPGTDYRTTYSARADLGGGVLLDAIHELDLLIWLFDDQLEVLAAIVDRVGELDIDVEDTVKVLLRHAGRVPIELSLDYLSRRYRRGVEVIGSEGTARLDWARAVLEVEDGNGVRTEPADTPIARSYEHEASVFVDWIQGRALPPVDGPTGLRSVRLADLIRDSATRASTGNPL